MLRKKIDGRKIVIVNQAVNYLTVGIANAFSKRFDDVSVITGHVHAQGEDLSSKIKVVKINKYREGSTIAKFFSWVIGTVLIFFLLLFKYRKHEVFFVSIPPMAYLLMFILRNRYTILIWDAYPDILKIYGVSEKNIIYKIWANMNNKLFKKAYRLYTIGECMADLISQYVDKNNVIITPLWSTFSNFKSIAKDDNYFIKQHGLTGKFIVQYSGNIGLTHNVDVLIDVADRLKGEKHIYFQIIGRGKRIQNLKLKIEKLKLDNCSIHPFQPDDVFPYSISAADLGVVILDDKTSRVSVPGKTYNLMTAGIPILYIASQDSELSKYAMKYENGACFNSSDVNSIVKFIREVSEDEALHQKLKNKSLMASAFYSRANADYLVNKYII